MSGQKTLFKFSLLAAVGVACSTLATAPSMAQEALKPPKFTDPEKYVAPPKARVQARVPGEQTKEAQEAARAAEAARKPGELENWSEPAAKGARGKGQAAGKGQANGKAAAQDGTGGRRAFGDGGLPLPSERTEDDKAAVGFDKSGNLGTGFKF